MQKTIPIATKRSRYRRGHPTPSQRVFASSGDTYTTDEVEFMLAMDQYKRDNRRPFPTWAEVLEVVKALGYRKVEPERAA